MIKRLAPLLCLLALAGPVHAQTDPLPAAPAESVQPTSSDGEAMPDQIVIVGKKPGPGLWKVSKGDHVLWIFGTYAPLPKKMEWRSQEVETVIGQSQEYLAPPSASASVGFFRQLTLLPYAIGLKKNPDGAYLKDVVPADVYARWLVLKAKYIGEDEGIERERPIFAAETLWNKGMAKSGLGADGEVRKAIEDLVKKNKLKTVTSNVKLPMDDPVRTIKTFKKTSLGDAVCFATTLDRMETNVAELRERALAWAKGDLETIRKLHLDRDEDACIGSILSSAFAQSQPELQNVKQRMQEAWLASAEKALAANNSTFAILTVKELLGEKSLLAQLQAKGYEVKHPD